MSSIIVEQKAQPDSVENLSDSILISATYDGDKKKAVLKFYEPKEKKIYLWEDNTNHKPYCLIRRDTVSLETLRELRSRKDVSDVIDIEKLDLRGDRKIMVAKVITTNPLAIGGGTDSIRSNTRTWESDIKIGRAHV